MNLSILEEKYPRAFFFRCTEGIEQYFSYEEWAAEFDSLQGIQGKSLAEEKSDRNLLHIRAYNRFKLDHPRHMVLLHFNGNARDPHYETKEFFAGHWLYTNGAIVESEVPDDFNGVCEIKVSDTSLFTLWTGRFFDRGEDLGLCDLDDSGKPDWNRSEQVQLVGIDHRAGTIAIRRGCHGTRPIGFRAGRSYIAPHIVEGPWNNPRNNLMWFYNYSTSCPRDATGRNCADVLADWLTHTFSPAGPLAHYDGLEFDVLFSSLHIHSYYYLQGIRHDGPKRPDCDADGVGDMGVIDGVNTYGVGVMEFCRKLRRQMGDDRLILADAGWWNGQRSFALLNGAESEGMEIDDDGHAQWGHVFNTHQYWNLRSRPPKVNYILLTKRHPKMTDGAVRIGMAAATLAGSAVSVANRPPAPAGRTPDNWDELVRGKDQAGPGWLGAPVGGVVRVALEGEDLLGALAAPPQEALLERLTLTGAQASIEGDSLRLTSRGPGPMRLSVGELRPGGPDMVVTLRLRGEAMAQYPVEGLRLVWLTAMQAGRPVHPTSSVFGTRQRRHAYFLDDAFVNTFVYNNLPEGSFELDLELEGDEPVWIDEIRAFGQQDVCYREYENGLIVVNPSKRPARLDLASRLPGRRFRRLAGRQCPDVNDGQPVGDVLELPVHDALFLVKQ